MDNHFKIISLTIHKGCNPDYLKVLKEGVEYRFYQDHNNAPSWLYDIPDGPKVSISSVVGKNGSGKSSIIEMMIRVMNNFAYLTENGEEDSDSPDNLTFIPGVMATIKYQVGSKICTLSCFKNTVSLKIPGELPIVLTKGEDKARDTIRLLAEVSDYLIFMFVSNYSLNSFNSRDYLWTSGPDWLSPLFEKNKNDVYRTPLYLNPWRQKGLIDVNLEHELSEQRLMALFTEATEEQEKETEDLFGVPKGEGFVFRLSEKDMLQEISLGEYFTWHVYDYMWRSKGMIDYSEQNHLSFWKRNAGLILSNSKFIDSAYKSIDLIDIVELGRSDLSIYLEWFEESFSNQGTDLPKDVIAVIRLLRKYPKLNFILFQRIFLIIWLDRRWFGNRGSLNRSSLKKDKLEIMAIKYVIYETIAVFERYPSLFDNCLKWIEDPLIFFSGPNDGHSFEDLMDNAVRKIEKDIKRGKSFMTLKIRQCLNYLSNQGMYNYREGEFEYFFGAGYKSYVPFGHLLALIRDKTKGPVIDFLPPPIFEVEIILRSGEKTFPISQISSGERQMLYMVGAIVYHLRNLGSSLNNELYYRYKNIHICLDEIELCFHPAYQRDMVNYLLGRIAAAHLPKDMRISITLLTHSPFVLSDIPQGNILYLKQGLPANKEINVNPFAANVNDILRQSFFLDDGFTGRYASAKIISLIKFLAPKEKTEEESSIHHWELDEIEQFLPIIGEPLMQAELYRLFWKWKIRSGRFNLEEEKRKVEDLAKVFGGAVQW